MSLQSDLREAYSLIHYDIAKDNGETLTYSNRSTTGVVLYAIPGPEQRRLDSSGDADIEVTSRSFSIARQTDFPPINDLAIDDEITYGGKIYFVVDWKSDPVGAVYDVDTERRQARRLKGN